MGVIKRILANTSNRLLAKLGAQRSSGRLVVTNLDQCDQTGLYMHHHAAQQTASKQAIMASLSTSHSQALGCSGKRSKRHQRKAKRESEALLLASKNNLPPVQFHHVHGPNAQLSKNKLVARRTQSFCQALVFSNRVILPNERVYIKVLEITKGWSGTIRFGFTSVDPATLRYQIPKHACPDMTSAGHTWARALADEVVRRNSVIHFSYSTDGYIHYGINNQDCGVFFAKVNTNQNLWFIIDIYGLTTAVELIDPRAHRSPVDLERSRVMSPVESPYQVDSRLKLTEDLCQMAGLPRSEKKRIKKEAARLQRLQFEQANIYRQNGQQQQQPSEEGWPSTEGIMMPRFDPAQAAMLPNLNSILLPGGQQNIYTPMPGPVGVRQSASMANLADTHDYYQIMTNTNYNVYQPSGPYSVRRGLNAPEASARPLGPARRSSANLAAASSSSPLTTSSANTSSTQSKRGNSSAAAPAGRHNQSSHQQHHHQQQKHHTRSTGPADEQEICQQLSSFNLAASGTDSGAQLAAESPISNSISKANAYNQHNYQPVAATRKSRQAHGANTSGSKRAEGILSTPAKSNGKQSNSTKQVRDRQHSNNTKEKSLKSSPASSRDDNNNSPVRNDCPICFERPINCVLYQCGHMCTCYECGVKQWRTQSRTCPICRTVIKDVIKTYMS